MASSSSVCSSKWPPKLDNELHYETWKRDIAIWCELTDLPEEKRALAIHLSLSGRARTASSEIPVEDLKKNSGVQTLLKKLDTLFLPDKGRRQFAAFHSLYNLRRGSGVSISEFVSEFEHTYFKFSQEDMKLPDAVMAFMLLASCNLSESDMHLVMSAVKEITYDGMKSTLKRIFGQTLGMAALEPAVQHDIKPEPVFHSESAPDATFYAKGNWRGRLQQGSRGSVTRSRGRRGSMAPAADVSGGKSGRKFNPVGRDGEISRCLICDSRLHWMRNCPHSYENNARQEENLSECVQLSLFMGYASDIPPLAPKLQTLLKESEGGAVLDTGCSTTVCGRPWLDAYTGSLSDYEREHIVEVPSSSTFTFGDGRTIQSVGKVTIPGWIGGIRSNITTDIVQCNIPLLLSRKSMKNVRMKICFAEDIVEVCGRKVKLVTTASGHYVLPIAL